MAWASRVALELGHDPSTPGKKRPSPVSLYLYLGVDCDGAPRRGALSISFACRPCVFHL